MGNKSELRKAIFNNKLSDVERLCKEQLNLINKVDSDSYTPLADALFYNNIQALEILHDNGVDYSIGWDDKPPLYWALLYSNSNIKCFLFSAPCLTLDKDSLRIYKALQAGKSQTEIIIKELGGLK